MARLRARLALAAAGAVGGGGGGAPPTPSQPAASPLPLSSAHGASPERGAVVAQAELEAALERQRELVRESGSVAVGPGCFAGGGPLLSLDPSLFPPFSPSRRYHSAPRCFFFRSKAAEEIAAARAAAEVRLLPLGFFWLSCVNLASSLSRPHVVICRFLLSPFASKAATAEAATLRAELGAVT